MEVSSILAGANPTFDKKDYQLAQIWSIASEAMEGRRVSSVPYTLKILRIQNAGTSVF